MNDDVTCDEQSAEFLMMSNAFGFKHWLVLRLVNQLVMVQDSSIRKFHVMPLYLAVRLDTWYLYLYQYLYAYSVCQTSCVASMVQVAVCIDSPRYE